MGTTTPPAPVTVPPWTNASELLPRGVATDFVGLIEQTSVVLRLGRVLRMSEAMEMIPLIAFMPQAEWVNPAYGGRKPASQIQWTSAQIQAEEVACTVPVPRAWIMDAHFDVEGQVERALASAIAYAIDEAVLFGTNAPASFPVGGVMAFADPVTGTDALDAISNGFADIEGKGIVPDGIGAGAAIGAVLRAAYLDANESPSVAPRNTLWGVPIEQSVVFQGAAAEAIVGGWQYLAIGIREDVTFGLSDDGVLLDSTGAILASAFQDNVRLVKVYARIGAAIGQPALATPGAQAPQKPFAAVTWTATEPAAPAP